MTTERTRSSLFASERRLRSRRFLRWLKVDL